MAKVLPKSDEFYTRYSDIESEIEAYLSVDSTIFEGKRVLLPTDSLESNIFKYFRSNFQRQRIYRLDAIEYNQHGGHGRVRYVKTNPEGIDSLSTRLLSQDGGYLSDEVWALRDKSDVIITNPPFSRLRTFLPWVLESEKKFSILVPLDTITNSWAWKAVQNGTAWTGYHDSTHDMFFDVPDSYREKMLTDGSKHVHWREIDGKPMRRIGRLCWFTNFETPKSKELPEFNTLAWNMVNNNKFIKVQTEKYDSSKYMKYDNFDALDIPVISAIPTDYEGIMGVPMSILDYPFKEKFNLIGILRNGTPNKYYGVYTGTNTRLKDKRGIPYSCNAPIIDGKPTFARVLIEWK